jgi:hypothetical protein
MADACHDVPLLSVPITFPPHLCIVAPRKTPTSYSSIPCP